MLSFLVVACTPKTSFSPKELPIAKLGQPYYAEIEIHSAPGPVMKETFGYLIKPDNSGLDLKPLDVTAAFPYNNLKVEGTPNVVGDVIIQFGGATYGTSSAGGNFDKTYIIKVENAE